MGLSEQETILDVDNVCVHCDVVEVVGEEFVRDIEFLELKAMEIDRKHTQQAMTLTEPIRKVTLPDNLQYVRMCKPLSEDRLLLIYGRSEDTPFRDLLHRHGINIYSVHTVKVPRYSPRTMEQYKNWSVHWPLKYLKPSVTPLKITPPIRQKMLTMMAEVLKESRNNNGRVVCHIAFKDRIIAKALDEQNKNILSHAALLAVRKVADMQYRDPKLMVKAKRRATGDQAEPYSVDGSQIHAEIPDYLCTQCEVFISHEPCCMCAMGLLHSRVATVTYFYPNPSIGALGSVHSLHTTPKLNHHFRVFMIKQQ